MKKTTTLCGKSFFAAGMFLFIALSNIRHGIAQGLADTSAQLNSLSPEAVDSVLVINKEDKKAVLVYLKDGRIAEPSDSISRLFISQSPDSKEPQTFKLMEQMPSFPGGEYEMMKYLYSHTRYPEGAEMNKIEGTVIVQFVVCKDGKLRDIRAVGEKIGWELDMEAMRIVKRMPDWIPGRYNGLPVEIMYRLPVKFVLSAGGGSVYYDTRNLGMQIGSMILGHLAH